MFLSHLHIENFRGLRKLDLDFDDTTILIGENAVGKTSVLEVLSICLGLHNSGDEFLFEDSDFYVGGEADPESGFPIQVELTFRERQEGEWDDFDRLVTTFVDGPDNLRQLRIRIEAVPSEDGAEVDWKFLDIEGQPLKRQPGPQAFRLLREINPFVLVRADRYFSPRRESDDPRSTAPARRRRQPELELEREISRVYNELIVSDGPADPEELRDGLSAVAKLLGENADRVFRNPESPARALAELVERPVALSIAAGPHLEARLHGAGARSVALLLLVGAMLEARGPTAIPPDAELIMAIEEPEVHLHPLLLRAVWSVIESLRTQKIVTTNSGEVVAAARLGMLRRLVRRTDRTDVFRLGPDTLSLDEKRKITYHIRLKRDDALFARAWLLVEGETEVWLLPEMARLLGYDFASDGIRCVEFAQSGIEPVIKVANDLGIEWHLIADGDMAGRAFAEVAHRYVGATPMRDRITLLREQNMEHCLWDAGYEYVYHSYARGRSYVVPTAGKKSRKKPSRVIEQAIRNSSKPHLALTVVEQVGEEGSPGVPPILRTAIETTLRLARTASPGALAKASMEPTTGDDDPDGQGRQIDAGAATDDPV